MRGQVATLYPASISPGHLFSITAYFPFVWILQWGVTFTNASPIFCGCSFEAARRAFQSCSKKKNYPSVNDPLFQPNYFTRSLNHEISIQSDGIFKMLTEPGCQFVPKLRLTTIQFGQRLQIHKNIYLTLSFILSKCKCQGRWRWCNVMALSHFVHGPAAFPYLHY